MHFSRLTACFMLTVAVTSAQTKTHHATAPTKQPESAKPTESFAEFPLDPTASALPKLYNGNDLELLYRAVKAAPELTDKSEYETTAAYGARRAAFREATLQKTIKTSDELGFMLKPDDASGPNFSYDADTGVMTIQIKGSREEFLLEKDRPTLDVLRVRSEIISNSTFLGTNAYGAKVNVHDLFAEDYGLAFKQDDWLFAKSDKYLREFTYLVKATPDEAREMKSDGRVLLVCHLVEPWVRNSVHGHDATIDDPYKTTVGENYLQIVPDQVWIYLHSSGKIIAEAEASRATDDEEKLSLLKNPIQFEVSGEGPIYNVVADGGKEDKGVLLGNKIFYAQKSLSITLDYPRSLESLSFKLNGRPYYPKWKKDSDFVGSQEFIKSASAVITLPE